MSQAPIRIDPLLQLNLVLHMSLKPPPGQRRTKPRPLLYESGYRLRLLSPRISIDETAQRRLAKAGYTIAGDGRTLQQATAPDLVLVREDDLSILLLELKTESFGSASSAARQLRAMMVLSRDELATKLGVKTADQSIGLAYVVGRGHEDMRATLLEEGKQLRAICSPSCERCSSYNLSGEEGVLLFRRFNDDELMGVTEWGTEVVVMHYESPEEMRPLYLVPYDPTLDYADDGPGSRDYHVGVLKEKTRTSIFAHLAAFSGDHPADVDLDSVAERVFGGLWGLLKQADGSKRLRVLMCARIRSTLELLHTYGFTYRETSVNRRWQVVFPPKHRAQLRKAMRTYVSKPPAQGNLLDET